MACHFDRLFQLPLMVGTRTGHSSGHNLAPFGDELFQHPGVLVVNGNIGILAKSAYSLP